MRQASWLYLDFFKKMYTEKIPWSEFSTYRDEVIIEIENKINEILTKSIYRNKKVIIE